MFHRTLVLDVKTYRLQKAGYRVIDIFIGLFRNRGAVWDSGITAQVMRCRSEINPR